MKENKFSIPERFRSFRYAFDGLQVLFSEEHNARLHVLAAAFALAAGFYFRISVLEWIAILLCIGFVFTMEIVNSAIERLCDFISPEKHEMIKQIKDLAAAAVFVSAVFAFVVGLIVFVPKIVCQLQA